MFKEFVRKIMAAINGSKPASDAGASKSAGKSAASTVSGDDNFQSEVLDSTIPVVVLFSAPWCSYCVKMAPVFDAVASQMSGKVKFVKINTDDNKAIKRRYGFQGIPTTGVWVPGTANGALKLKSGFMPEAALKAFITGAIKK